MSWLDRRYNDGDGGPGGWLFLLEPELHLEAPGRPIDPDLAGWRREPMPVLPRTASTRLAPDWLCEVLSPSTETYDRGPQMETYARAGVPHVWLVDPEARTLEAYLNDAGTLRPLGRWQGTGRVPAAPFETAPLELALLRG